MKEDWWLIRIREKVWQENWARNGVWEPGKRQGDPVALKNLRNSGKPSVALKKCGTKSGLNHDDAFALKKFSLNKYKMNHTKYQKMAIS